MISSLKAALCSTVCLSLLLPTAGFAGSWIINGSGDAFVSIGGTGSATGTGAALSGTGDMRYVLNQIINDQAQYPSLSVTQTITFDPSVTSVTLIDFPPPINLFRSDIITITGSQTIIDGGGFRPFYLTQGTVSLERLVITNGVGQGGAGSCGGGGGMGAGGAIFIHGADVTLVDVTLTNCSAISGSGGSTDTGLGAGPGGLGGGGGGLGGPGGGNVGFNEGSGGGGGYGAAGGDGYGAGGGSLGDGGYGNSYAGGGGGSSQNGGGGGGAIIGAGGGTNNASGLGVLGYVFGGGGAGLGGSVPSSGGSGGGINPNLASQSGGGGGYNDPQITSPNGGVGGGGGGGSYNGSSGGPGGIGGGGGGGCYGGSGSAGNGGYLGGGGGSGAGDGAGIGGFGGGGGAADSGSFGTPSGGLGGFGGGGGSSSMGFGGGNGGGGDGGFGGGGGSSNGNGYGVGGAGATTADLYSGGYGAAFGGAIFIGGTGSITFGQNVVTDSSAVTSIGGAAGVGSDLFAVSGATLIFAPALNTTVTLAGSIADDSPTSLPGSGYTPGTGSGSSIIVQGTGTVVFLGANTYTGTTTISSGVLQLSGTGSISSSPLTVTSTGTFDISPLTNGGTTITDLSGGSTSSILLGTNTLTLDTSNISSYAGVITGGSGGGITKQGLGTLTLTGIISGSGSLTQTGSGTLVLTATNSYTGSTTISAGVLQLSGLGSISNSPLTLTSTGTFDISPLTNEGTTIIDLSGSSGTTILLGTNTLTLDSTSSTSYAGSISGSGGIIKQGSGTIDLQGVNTYTGTTTINGGFLAVNGSILSAVTVLGSGSTLSGTGVINAPILVMANATISPGNSIGTLTGSSVFFDASSAFHVEIDPSSASKLVLTGTASIDTAATVHVTQDAGVYLSAKSYPILSADGGISGSFNPTVNVISGLPGYYFSLLQTGNLVTLQYSTFAPVPPFVPVISLIGLRGNALKIAKYLNEYAPTETIKLFTDLSGSSLDKALISVSPSRNAVPVSVTQQTAFTLSGIVSSHLDTFRMAKRGFAKKSSPKMSSSKKSAYQNEKLQYDIYDDKGESSYYIDRDIAENEQVFNDNRGDTVENSEESYDSQDEFVADDSDTYYFLDKGAPEYDQIADGFDINHLLVDASDQMLPTPYTKEVSVYKENDFCGWISGLAQYAHQKAEQQNPSYNFLSEVLTTGFDYRGIEKTLLGGGLGYAHTHYSEGGNVGHGNINYYFSTVYANAYIDQFYLSPALLGVYNQVHNTRNISFPGFSEKAKASINSWQFTPHLEVGYDVEENRWGNITPFTALDWVINWQQAYNEEGAAPFTARQSSKRTSMARSETGFKFSQAFSYSWGALLLKEKGSYIFEKPFGTSNLHTGFVGLPSALTVITGTSPLNLGSVGFDLQARVGQKKPISIKMGFEGEMGVRYLSGEVNLMLSKDF